MFAALMAASISNSSVSNDGRGLKLSVLVANHFPAANSSVSNDGRGLKPASPSDYRCGRGQFVRQQ